MPYPMINKTKREKWEKSIEEKVGLPVSLIRDISPRHLNFYLQNRRKVKIGKYNNEILFTILDDKFAKFIYKKIYGFEPIRSDIGHFFFGEKILKNI